VGPKFKKREPPPADREGKKGSGDAYVRKEKGKGGRADHSGNSERGNWGRESASLEEGTFPNRGRETSSDAELKESTQSPARQ